MRWWFRIGWDIYEFEMAIESVVRKEDHPMYLRKPFSPPLSYRTYIYGCWKEFIFIIRRLSFQAFFLLQETFLLPTPLTVIKLSKTTQWPICFRQRIQVKKLKMEMSCQWFRFMLSAKIFFCVFLLIENVILIYFSQWSYIFWCQWWFGNKLIFLFYV